MKYITLITCLSLMTLTTSKIKPQGVSSQNAIFYNVYKIDSLNRVYLIYAKKINYPYKIAFKIVSKKVKISDETIKPDETAKIVVNGKYDFKLHSILYMKIGNATPAPGLVNCIGYYEDQICLEGDSVTDLYYADNLKGLYFVNTKK